MTRRALVVIGSRTSEHRHGVASGERVADALRRREWSVEIEDARAGRSLLGRLLATPPNIVVPVGFGPPCEDGHVFAAARLAGVPCAGPSPAAGGSAQDKALFAMVVADVFKSHPDIRPPKSVTLTSMTPAGARTRLVKTITAPLLVKAAFGGSSEGLAIARDHKEALAMANDLLPVEGKVLVQALEGPILHEVSATILDRPDGPMFFPLVELRRDDVPIMGVKEKFGPEGLDRHILPARLSEKDSGRIFEVVRQLKEVIGPIGLCRIDLLLLANGEIVVLELNGIAGLLDSSIACDAAKAAGLSFDDLAEAYAESAMLPRPEPQVWDGKP